jgi:hypothetical protein
MFGRDVKHKFKGQHLADSAEWWGAFNDQMRIHKERKLMPSVKALEKELSNVNEFGDDSQKKQNESNVILEKSSSSPDRPPPMPPRSKSSLPLNDAQRILTPDAAPQPDCDQLNEIQNQATNSIPASEFNTSEYYNFQMASLPSLSPDLQNISITERMDMAMKSRTIPSPDITPEIPSFEVPIKIPEVSTSISNPWDSFEADQAKW